MTRNTTKSKPGDDDTGGRRRSARLADLDKDKPKESPKVAKKSVEKSVEKKKKSPSKRSSKASKKEQEEPNNVPSVVIEKGDEEINLNEEEKESEKVNYKKVNDENVENLVDLNNEKKEAPIENSVEVNETETTAVATTTQSNGGDTLVTNEDISVVKDTAITQNGNGISISNNIIEKSIITTKEISSKEENKLAVEPQTIETATV